jgi:uncharacterized protein YyaL (SSP411 family)
LCHQHTGDGLYRRRATETVEWLRREMIAPAGAFCASLDADSEGAEGRFYVWTMDEIVATLGEADTRFFAGFYDASRDGNWHDESRGENVIILNRLASPSATPEEEARLAPLREKLRLKREGRPHPGRDDKIMADWNGLMIAALVKAALAFEEPEWIDLAARAYAFIVAKLGFRDLEGRRRLAHSWRADALVSPGLALDHAAMVSAALALHEARIWTTAAPTSRDFLVDAIAWAETLESYHRDPGTGLLRMAAWDTQDLILLLSPTADDAIPTAHSVYLSALTRLAAQTGDDQWRRRADALFAALTPAIEANFFGHLACLNALDTRLRAKTIVTIGPLRQKLLAAALRLPYFDRIEVDADGSRPRSAVEAAQWEAVKGKDAAAFVCAGETCSLPVWNEKTLRATLEAFDAATS